MRLFDGFRLDLELAKGTRRLITAFTGDFCVAEMLMYTVETSVHFDRLNLKLKSLLTLYFEAPTLR